MATENELNTNELDAEIEMHDMHNDDTSVQMQQTMDTTQTNPTHIIDLSISLKLLFVIFSLGPSWMLLDGMYIQVPYFQRSQPESVKMAAKMSLSGSTSMMTVVPIYFLLTNMYPPSSNTYRKLIYGIILFQLFLTVFIAIFWSTTINDFSFIIMLVTHCSAGIGHLQTIAIIPWLLAFNPEMSSLIMFGGGIASVIASCLGLIQSPGSNKPLFGPSAYYSIMLICILCSLVSWIYLDRNIITPKQCQVDRKQRLTQGQSHKLKCIPLWWRKVYIYAIIDSFIQLITWSFIRSALPFAIAHSVKYGAGERSEQYAIEFSYIAVTAGSFCANIIKLQSIKSFVIVCLIFGVFTLIFMVFVIDSAKHLIFKGESVLIVIIVGCMRFIDGWITPLIFRRVAVAYPNESLLMNKWIAGVEKLLSFGGVWIIYIIVEAEVIH
eukprot:67002_1